MKAELLFQIRLPWQQTLYEPLSKFSISCKWHDKEGVWVFRYSDIKLVKALVGNIEIEGVDEIFEEVEVPEFKGKDKIEIKEFPKIFQIIEHRKVQDDDGNVQVKEIRHNLPKERVDLIWKEVIAKQPLQHKVMTSTVAENICSALGVTRFNRETGTFQFDKFFGSRRNYYELFYLVMKVLVWQGRIIHWKSGKVERIQ